MGNAAAQFTADWTAGPADPLPGLGEMQAFVDDYELVRGHGFDRSERDMLDAANLFLCAYGARCQHSDATYHRTLGGSPANGWMRLLRERGERGLIT